MGGGRWGAMSPSRGARAPAGALAASALLCLVLAPPPGAWGALEPVVRRGRLLYKARSGERFFARGVTFGYAVDDAHEVRVWG